MCCSSKLTEPKEGVLRISALWQVSQKHRGQPGLASGIRRGGQARGTELFTCGIRGYVQAVSRWRGAARSLGVRVLHLRVGSLHTHLGTLAGNSLTPQNISSGF